MNWVLSVLAGLAVALLVLYIINRNQAPVAIETYVQQPVRKGAPIIDIDSMLVAVGLEAIYTPRPSVMDSSEISQDAWLAAQAAAQTAGPPATTTQPRVQEAAPVGAGSGMAGAPMWSAGAVSGQQAGGAIQQVFLPGGTAIEQLVTPPPTSASGGAAAAAPRAKTAAEIQAEQDRAYQADLERSALLQESANAANERAKIAALKAAAQQRYKEVWLPSRSGAANKQDTVANRAAFVAVLVAELNTAKTNFQYYFESDWIARNGAYRGNSALTAAYNTARMEAQQTLEDLQDQINALDTNWQNSITVDCYPIPWDTRIGSETACSKTCGPGKKTQTRAYQEPLNGGQACPALADRETRDVDCNNRDCTRTVEASVPVCAPGYTYRSSDRKCVNVSQIPASQGCPAGFTYQASGTDAGKCTKASTTPVTPTPPTGYTWNATLKQFEIKVDPTWSCSRAGFNLDRGILGLTYPPECIGYI